MNLLIFKQIKRLFLPTLFFSLLLISCSEERALYLPEVPSIEKQKLTIKASSLSKETKSVTTRITVDADRKDNIWTNSEPITWVEGDAFKVKFLGTENSEYVETFTLSSIDDNDAYFDGTPPEEGGYGVYAFYPASKATFEATEKKLTMPREQIQKGNDYSHLGKTAYMYDKVATTANTGVYVNADGSLSEDLTLNFKHLTSLIRFHVTNNTGTSIKVESIKMSFSGANSQLYKTVKFDESTGMVTLDESAIDNEYDDLTLKIEESPSISANGTFDGYMSIFQTNGYESTSTEYYNFEVSFYTTEDPTEIFNVDIPIDVKDMNFGGDKLAKFEAGKRYVIILDLIPGDMKITPSTERNIQVPRPASLLRLDFFTEEALPTAKGTVINGLFRYRENGNTSFAKHATLEVQGSSSAAYPKKNWTIALFENVDLTEESSVKLGALVEHTEFVFKSNYIDATHSRNIAANRLWEQIVQSRESPKRENEMYTGTSSGALCHVECYPAELYVNGEFYGIGCFNLGKKRENYDLDKDNQNHIQMAAETHVNMFSYRAADWDIRNPKEPDADFQSKVDKWFAVNSLTGAAFREEYPKHNNLRNSIDYYIFAEFIMAVDAYRKNWILTTWDGIIFSFCPYDLDSTFGLHWSGLSWYTYGKTIRYETGGFWDKFYNAFPNEIKERYRELRWDILTIENVSNLFEELENTFGRSAYEKDFARWPEIPSNNENVTTAAGTGGVFTSTAQVCDWTIDRIDYLDDLYMND
jgi:CotH protein.